MSNVYDGECFRTLRDEEGTTVHRDFLGSTIGKEISEVQYKWHHMPFIWTTFGKQFRSPLQLAGRRACTTSRRKEKAHATFHNYKGKDKATGQMNYQGTFENIAAKANTDFQPVISTSVQKLRGQISKQKRLLLKNQVRAQVLRRYWS
jgi:hypothetical protein